MNWVKPYWKIKIREYNLMEKTGLINQFKEWYNPFPVKYFVKSIGIELKTLAGKLNATFGDKEEIQREALLWQIKSHNLINGIRNSILGVLTILDLGDKLSQLTTHQTTRVRRKLKFKKGNLKIYTDNIKQFTGIEINSLKDIVNVNEYLQYKVDKYNQMMQKQQTEEPSGNNYLMDVVVGVFTYLNQTANVELTVLEFIDFRNNAIEKSNKEKANARN